MRKSIFITALLFITLNVFGQNTKTLDDEKMTDFAYKLSALPSVKEM